VASSQIQEKNELLKEKEPREKESRKSDRIKEKEDSKPK